ncbi:alpha/beta hydrolase [Variovorax sp. J22G73]|uniref:alpha/beta fold hydrolase n=1 Tax=unclassified Variovorax TaxID=663243 RepID=UPI002576EC90|nr:MULTISPECIES: alpha/beta hydrolase [unclassified Variovorax]MDM0005616.1 alpha/beta hydrolase [Variovorax sp. J22R203]MDM0099643.1 alpha/beta hydrolase [Variovorax sp. J22G73]
MRIGPGAAVIVGLAVLAGLVGVVYEQVGRFRAARDFPPPGRMVDIGGRRTQLDCRGSGSPTVVFEAGQSVAGALDWAAVQPKVAAHTRACAYSRAGLMWSDASSEPSSAKQVAQDLHAALTAAGERGPFVMVGQSIGGPYVVSFTRYYGAQVAGLVLVDPSHPDQAARVAQYMVEKRSPLSRLFLRLGWTGLLRVAAPRLLPRMPHQSEQEVAAIRAFAPLSFRAELAESDATERTLAEAGAFRELGDRPLVVLTAMAPYTESELHGMKITPAQGKEVQALWKQMHDDIATWSTRGTHRLLPNAGHDIQFDEPDAVVDAVLSVVRQVRALGPAPASP